MDSLVAANLGADLHIELSDGLCRYAIALQAVEGTKGALVVRAEIAPSSGDCSGSGHWPNRRQGRDKCRPAREGARTH